MTAIDPRRTVAADAATGLWRLDMLKKFLDALAFGAGFGIAILVSLFVVVAILYPNYVGL